MVEFLDWGVLKIAKFAFTVHVFYFIGHRFCIPNLMETNFHNILEGCPLFWNEKKMIGMPGNILSLTPLYCHNGLSHSTVNKCYGWVHLDDLGATCR
jgi:hypothetical protein